jgi:hypothetical protein
MGSGGIHVQLRAHDINVRFWPVADIQVQEIMAVQAAASDPKRTLSVTNLDDAFAAVLGEYFGSRYRLWNRHSMESAKYGTCEECGRPLELSRVWGIEYCPACKKPFSHRSAFGRNVRCLWSKSILVSTVLIH